MRYLLDLNDISYKLPPTLPVGDISMEWLEKIWDLNIESP